MHTRCIKLIIGGGSAQRENQSTRDSSESLPRHDRWQLITRPLRGGRMACLESTGKESFYQGNNCPCAAAALKVYQNSRPEIGMIGAGDSCGTRIKKPRLGIQ
jgi:hypothetical protein